MKQSVAMRGSVTLKGSVAMQGSVAMKGSVTLRERGLHHCCRTHYISMLYQLTPDESSLRMSTNETHNRIYVYTHAW
jgi:hypothetical protein